MKDQETRNGWIPSAEEFSLSSGPEVQEARNEKKECMRKGGI